VRRYAAPGALLLAVTAAVLGIHYGFQSHPAKPPPVTTSAPQQRLHPKRHATTVRYVRVEHGDSFSSIAVRNHTTVAALARLNPGASTTSLRVGQKIRVH
jgi:LysM repeat protein